MHADAQHPHDKQMFLSMVTTPSLSDIAPTGQTSAHSRHFLHFSVITFTVLPTIIALADCTSHAKNVQ